jgi:archaeal type IV pilus assembly protein PilA
MTNFRLKAEVGTPLMKFMHTRERKAISPIIATVLIIAVTLIAAVAIAGFVFGIFSSGASTAQVAVTAISCSSSGNACIMTLTNTGNAVTNPGGTGVITYAGVSQPLTTTTTSNIPAGGGNLQVTYSMGAPATAPVAGQQYTGYVALANGEQVQFAGTFAT